MSDRQYLSPDNQQPADKPGNHNPPAGPPINWPGRSATDNERAAALARQKVEGAYQSDNRLQSTENRQGQSGDQHTMRNQTYDWDTYHTAWQQYYHQYFYRYYANWMQEQNAQANHAKQLEPQPDPNTTNELRQKIRSEVSDRTKKLTRSSHFKPLLAASTVALVFLLINYNQILIGRLKQYLSPSDTIATPVIVEPGSSSTVGPEPKVVIPKIGVDAHVVYDEPRVDEASFQKALERGAVRLGTTANPGTKGNVVIGGHSSNNVFNAGQFKYIFVNLRRLDVNDILYLNYNSQRYTYKVTVKKVISPKDTSILKQTDTPMVTIFTCDPPGANVNRLIVQAVQIDPNPTVAVANTNAKTAVNTANPLPSVAPSLWDRLFRR